MSKKSDSAQGVERPVSLNPLNLEQALGALLSIPEPEKTAPKRKKTPSTTKE